MVLVEAKINDVEAWLMDVCGCAVRLSGWPEMPGHRSKRRRESSVNEIDCIILLVEFNCICKVNKMSERAKLS